MMQVRVRVRREPMNPVDGNAVLVITKTGSILGHLEREFWVQ